MKVLTKNVSVLLWGGALLAVLGAAQAQEIPTAEQAIARVNEVAGMLGLKNLNLGELPGIKGFNFSSLPIETMNTVLKLRCEKNGGQGSYEAVSRASMEFGQRVRALFANISLQKEIEEAKPKGELDLVFGKHCLKKDAFRGHLENLMRTIDGCLEERERETRAIARNITDALLTFVCDKEGDRIALFVAAGGPECFQSKQEDLKNCLNSTISEVKVPEGADALNNLPSLIFDKQVCQNMVTFQGCAVKKLEECEDPTPANLLDSVINFIKKKTPCQQLLKD